MKVRFNRGNQYFDTYSIYDENGKFIGLIEDHCRGVEKQYFIGWKFDDNSIRRTGKTAMFDTREEAIAYSISK